MFTDRPLAGNQLAVVHDADGVDDDTMGAFARETRLSETTFVQSPTKEGADYRNRIWTVAGEVPFAGHPSLGTAVAFAQSQGTSDGSSSSRRRRACSRSTCGATGTGGTRRCSRSRRRSGRRWRHLT